MYTSENNPQKALRNDVAPFLNPFEKNVTSFEITFSEKFLPRELATLTFFFERNT